MPDVLLPGCGAIDCVSEAPPAPTAPARLPQVIDYQAKDFESFRAALLALMPSRIPGWRDRSEADLGMVIVELLAYGGDLLSYHQDRVAGEAFLRTARRYDSVRRHLNLVDYRLDPGSAAGVILAVTPTQATYLPAGFPVWTATADGDSPVVFETDAVAPVYPEIADLALAADAPADPTGTEIVLALDQGGPFLPVGALLHLREGDRSEWIETAAPPVADLVAHTTTVRAVAPLAHRYTAGPARASGNGVRATHGATHRERAAGTGAPGLAVALESSPLTYVTTTGGVRRSTLTIEVDGEPWREVEDFVDSGPLDPHFRVERDRDGSATVRFGDGVRGRIPPAPAPLPPGPPPGNIRITYRSGIGEAGLVAARRLTVFSRAEAAGLIAAVTNPEPSRDAVEPESPDVAALVGPRTLRRQLRAVVPEDYAAVLREGVRFQGRVVRPLQAKAQPVWTGTWTTVFVSLDWADRRPLAATPGLADALEAALHERKLAGTDVAVRDATYAPLRLGLRVWVHVEHFARRVRQEVLTALRGFFAPGRFGFGDPLHLSDLYAAVLAVPGVTSAAVTRFKRLGDRYPDREAAGSIGVGPFEIIRCDNDPAHPEHGVLAVRTVGGKEG
jgi:hypothetical protein